MAGLQGQIVGAAREGNFDELVCVDNVGSDQRLIVCCPFCQLKMMVNAETHLSVAITNARPPTRSPPERNEILPPLPEAPPLYEYRPFGKDDRLPWQ